MRSCHEMGLCTLLEALPEQVDALLPGHAAELEELLLGVTVADQPPVQRHVVTMPPRP